MSKNSLNKRWVLKPYDAAAAAKLARAFQTSDITAALLTSRGITDLESADRFFNPTLDPLHDRIMLAISRKEKILIYGDYDVDGTTSTVILKKALSLIGADVSYYIPERLKDGYGLREDAMDMAKAPGVHLIISVATGIRAQQVVEYAKSRGLEPGCPR